MHQFFFFFFFQAEDGIRDSSVTGVQTCALPICRPYLWGLGAFGQQGVVRIMEILRAELAADMGMAGKGKILGVKCSFLTNRLLRVDLGLCCFSPLQSGCRCDSCLSRIEKRDKYFC